MLSQTVEYALRAMASLALSAENRIAASSIAETTQVPPDYLAKVLQQLAKADLITGRRGVGGGYQLATTADQISLIDVVNAVVPIERITSCPLGLGSHGSKLCPLHRKMDEAIEAVLKIFGDATLADMIHEKGANTPLCESRNGDGTASLTIGGSR